MKAYLSTIARRGGQSKSDRKRLAVVKNLKAANAVRIQQARERLAEEKSSQAKPDA